jgi:hypothetical protein
MEGSTMQIMSVTPRTVVLSVLLALGTVPLVAVAAKSTSEPSQLTFASADEAVAMLVDTVKQSDQRRLLAVLGPGSETLINSGDRHADAASHQRFLTAFDARHKLTEVSPGRMVLDVGIDDWSLPIPVVHANGRWHFDSRAGAQEIVNRRIGRNEIAAIRVALAYVDAQRDYFERSKQSGGTGQYAQHLVSTPNQHDGLYWPVTAGQPESPFGPLVAQAVEEGYPGEMVSGRPIPYQGYYFRVLRAQGENAPGGAKDYLMGGRMTGGFALIAWPAIYRSSGIMTFLVNHDGVVFQKDLGSATATAAAGMTRFDPDLTWARVDVTSD